MILIFALSAFAADLTCADIQEMLNAGKSEEQVIEQINRSRLFREDLECLRGSGMPVAVMVAAGQRLQASAPPLPPAPPAREDEEQPPGSPQYECALFPIWNSSMVLLPRADQTNAKVASVSLPRGWTPIGGFTSETTLTGSQAVIMACRKE